MVIKKAYGIYVENERGDRLVDLTSQGGVLGLGHNNPLINEAITAQTHSIGFMHRRYEFENVICIGGTTYTVSRKEVSQQIQELLKGVGDFDNLYFNVSGASSIVTALKAAKIIRVAQDAPLVTAQKLLAGQELFPRFCFLTFQNVYHGHLGDSQIITHSKPSFTLGASPGIDAIRLEFPDIRKFPTYSKTYIKEAQSVIQRAKKKYEWRLGGFVFEPIQGDTRIPNGEILVELCEEMRRQNVLLIADEIKVGLGRTGKDLACLHYNIRPDIVVLSKALANGRPTGVVGVSKTLPIDTVPADWEMGTFISEPIASVATIITLDILKRQRLSENSSTLGTHLLYNLRKIFEGREEVLDIRGRGLFVGVEFADGDIRDSFYKNCLREGLLTSPSKRGGKSQVIVIMPPLIISKGEVDSVLDSFKTAYRKTFV